MASGSKAQEGPRLTEALAPRLRKVKILATLGPASSDARTIRKLMVAGADAFRINMSHGDHKQKAKLVAAIRALRRSSGGRRRSCSTSRGRSCGSAFRRRSRSAERGERFVLDGDEQPATRAESCCRIPSCSQAVTEGARILIDDGKVRLKVLDVEDGRIVTQVEVGGRVPTTRASTFPTCPFPIPALTEKDRIDLAFALEQKTDWVALSFVQRPEDVAEARSLIGERAALMAKIEKPAAIDRLDDIIALADGVMVARGDLGVELPPEAVPPLQNKIVACARQFGKPVIVATQMLESMISSPTPTRAEVSDVATAIYDGTDAVMLSAESAAGQYPVEAVAMMDRIAKSVERDPSYSARIHFTQTKLEPTTADALAGSARQIAITVSRRRWCATRARGRPRDGSPASGPRCRCWR
jgi:pyruvate kinase